MTGFEGSPVVSAANGLIATSHPLASKAGLGVLKAGGNAVDAAVTAAATLCVVEPTMTGLGGDLFALLFRASDRTIHALNASGRSPRSASLDELSHQGMPASGVLSVSVPGAVDGWHLLLRDHGTLPLGQALAPAINYARSGFEVTPVVASQWRDSEVLLLENAAASSTFLVDGRAPRSGEVFSNPRLGATLERLALLGRDEFYHGDTATRIARAVSQLGGWLDETDLAAHTSDWVTPLRTIFRGHEVLELPPNTQGVTAIEILNLIERGIDPGQGHNSPGHCHLLAEAIRIAFADRDAYVADPSMVPVDVIDTLISKEYARSRLRDIDPLRAAEGYRAGLPGTQPRRSTAVDGSGDTVYLTAADQNGNVISLIQSLYGAFGSGVVAGDTGIVLQNRGALFSLDRAHPNCLAPRKRPFHTLIPAMVLRDGVPWLSYGVMGGDMQAQGHAQVLSNLVVFGMNVQEAGEAARIRWTGDALALESGVPTRTRDALARRGHQLTDEPIGFGGYQGIVLDSATGTMQGGSDPRKDGCAMGY